MKPEVRGSNPIIVKLNSKMSHLHWIDKAKLVAISHIGFPFLIKQQLSSIGPNTMKGMV